MLLAQQTHLFGKATPDFSVAAIGEQLDENSAVDFQYRQQLACHRPKHGDH